jgi:hypothetical protein
MKTTLEIPDVLYRRVKTKSTQEGLPVGDIAIRLFSEWVQEPAAPASRPAEARQQPLPPWFGIANAYAVKVKRHDMSSIRSSITTGKAKT